MATNYKLDFANWLFLMTAVMNVGMLLLVWWMHGAALDAGFRPGDPSRPEDATIWQAEVRILAALAVFTAIAIAAGLLIGRLQGRGIIFLRTKPPT